MAKQLNGTWKVIATVGGFIIVIVGAAVAYGAQCNQVDNLKVTEENMKPEVKQNTEHRIKFEEKVSTMEKNIALILEEVRK